MMAGGAELKQLSQELQNLASDPDVAQVARELAADDVAALEPAAQVRPADLRAGASACRAADGVGDAGHDAREDPAGR